MKKGFTLIELIVVIAIITILGGLVMGVVGAAQNRQLGEENPHTVIVHRESGITEYKATSVTIYDNGMVRFKTVEGQSMATPVTQTEVIYGN